MGKRGEMDNLGRKGKKTGDGGKGKRKREIEGR